MTKDNNKPGADAPGEKKSFVLRPAERELSLVTSVAPKSEAHPGQSPPSKRQAEVVIDPQLDGGAWGTDAVRLAARPGRRQAEAVVDPGIDETPSGSRPNTLIALLPPEAVVRLVLFAGRMAKKQGKPLPQNIAERLGEALARGDAAAPALRDWAIRIGALDGGAGGSSTGSQDPDHGLAGIDRVTEHDRATMRAVMLARHLRERLGMSRPPLQAKAGRKTSLGSRPIALSDSGDASPTVSDDPGRRS